MLDGYCLTTLFKSKLTTGEERTNKGEDNEEEEEEEETAAMDSVHAGSVVGAAFSQARWAAFLAAASARCLRMRSTSACVARLQRAYTWPGPLQKSHMIDSFNLGGGGLRLLLMDLAVGGADLGGGAG